MMPSNNNYAAWVYGSLQSDAARFCSTERLASDPNPLLWEMAQLKLFARDLAAERSLREQAETAESANPASHPQVQGCQ